MRNFPTEGGAFPKTTAPPFAPKMHPLEILLKLGLFAMQSVLIGSEYPVMDTLLFYVKNGEKPELPIIIRSGPVKIYAQNYLQAPAD